MAVERRTRYHHVRVIDRGGVRTLSFERAPQSSMRLDDPFETDFEYPAYLHLPLAVYPQASRTLVVGLGGGSLVKRMWRDYAWMHIDAVELDPVVIEFAYSHFALPRDPRIRVRADDGRRFLERTDAHWDIVVIDAFDDDAVPGSLMTDEFLRTVRDHLTDGGVLAFNFIGSVRGDGSKPFRSLYRTVANIWGHLWVFPCRMTDRPGGGRDDNVVLLATDRSLTTEELLAQIESRVGGRVTVPGFETFGADLYREPIRSGDVRMLIDRPNQRRAR